MRNGKKDMELSAWEEAGKIYLPDPPPALAADKIEDPAAYIAENFDTNGAVWRFRPGSHASRRSLLLSLALLFLLTVILVLSLGWLVSFLLGIVAGAVVIGIAGIVFAWRYKRNLYTAKVKEFRLVRPSAVKKGCGEKGDRAYENYIRRKTYGAEGVWALTICYEYEGEPREAETEALYTREQLDLLVSAFLKGELVVACRTNKFWGDRAVVCSPDLLSIHDQTSNK